MTTEPAAGRSPDGAVMTRTAPAPAATQVKWEHLREVPLRGLQPGDRWITLAPGTVCWVSPEGRVRGHFVDEPRGTIWTLQSWDADTATATSDDGDERSQQIAPTVKVNRIVGGA